jgi:hypothetical protein
MIGNKLDISIENYSYARLIDEIISVCKKRKYQIDIIGYEKFEKIGMIYPLYRIIIHPHQKKNIHCIVAGIHGYEIAGPLSILELVKKPGKYLSKKICYHIYPIINPTGFDLRTRYDDEKRELNTINPKILKSRKYGEVKAFYDHVKNKYFKVFISLHEDVDEHRFYEYVFEEKEKLIYRTIIARVAKKHKILKASKIYGDKSDGSGLIINSHDRSFEDFLFVNNKADIAVCTETPGKIPIKERISINLNNIKILSNQKSSK